MYGYTHDIKDEDGKVIVADLDCEIEVETTFSGGELTIEVTGVWIDGAELIRSKDPVVRGIGCNIAAAANGSDWLREKVMEDEGIHYVGRGGNDPDGRLVQR